MEVLGVFLVLAIPVAFVWALVKAIRQGPRISELERRSEEQSELIRRLTARVYELEYLRPAVQPLPPEPLPEPAIAETLIAPVPEPQPAPEPVPEPQLIPEPEPQPEPVLVGIDDTFDTPAPPPAPTPTRDWEAVVGGSWLNAIGTLILVVGISLFLGYALTQFGPLGKIAIGAAVSVFMIAAGIFVERQERYAIAGRGLIAGGWASLYFTAFAAHGLPAARVIDSPLAGGLLLLLVASAMILHSLRYGSQTLTMLAYASAYVALILGPLSTFGIAASVPLTLSLLAVSRAMQWQLIPVAGMVLTYWTFAFRYDPAEVPPTVGTLALLAYWLAFEIYDLARLRAAWKSLVPESGLFFLNTILFFGAAFLSIPPGSRTDAANFLTVMGAFYLASAILRIRWSLLADPEPEAEAKPSLLPTVQQLALGIASGLFALSILRRFADPVSAQAGLLLEAQLLVLAGVRLRMPLLRHLGAVLFAFCTLLLAARAHEFHRNWVPFAFVMPGLFYLNRYLTREGRYYTWGAVPLLFAGILEVTPDRWQATALALFVLALTEAWRRFTQSEFRWQALLVGLFLVIATLADHNVWLDIALAAALFVLASWRQHPADARLRDFAWGGAITLAACSAWHALPAALVGPAWGLLALVTLELSLILGSALVESQAHAMAAGGFGRLFFANFTITTQTGFLSHRILTVAPMLALAYHGWQRARLPQTARLYCWTLTILAGVLLRFELGRTLVVLGWAALMLVVLHFGLRRHLIDLRLQAYLLAGITFLRGWATNFNSADTLLGISERITVGLAVIAAFHAGQLLHAREERYPRSGYALLGTALLSILLFYEVSGGLLTIAWGMQAVASLLAGFALRERVMRLAGLFLLMICVLK
ncbi:MAG: DUF2339 domain-containing protein, partial [Bryobacterales bacterium]|nr:DUF2339 domain-containing protein [Bryobacterales bacterium]